MSNAPTEASQAEGSRFLARPASLIGRTAAGLFAAAIVGVVSMAAVGESAPPAVRMGFGVLVVALVMSTAACGTIGILVKRERSWVVVIPTVICLAIVVNEVVQQLRVL